MNIRKPVDYSEMFASLGVLMEKDLTQMELYCEIGRLVCTRSEKGAAVAASEYLVRQYPEMSGFSPRNLRRMRSFYQLYAEMPETLALAKQISWTQNVVLMESELEIEQYGWYLKAAKKFKWTKTELIQAIEVRAHETAEPVEDSPLGGDEATAVEQTNQSPVIAEEIVSAPLLMASPLPLFGRTGVPSQKPPSLSGSAPPHIPVHTACIGTLINYLHLLGHYLALMVSRRYRNAYMYSVFLFGRSYAI